MTDEAFVAGPALDMHLGGRAAEDAYRSAVQRAVDGRWAERLFSRDSSLWSDDPLVQDAIPERLGWLDVPATFRDRIPALEGFGEGIGGAGFTDALVCGMGAGGIAPRMLASIFGVLPDWLAVRVLDSTDPAAVDAAMDGLDRLTTLVVISSRSGESVETVAFEAEAWERIERALKGHHAPRWESAGDLMVAVTGPDSALRAIPHHDRLREVFLNPPQIGGRYGPLSYVGLVPASLLGVDLDPFLDGAALMLERCRLDDPAENPGLALGLALGSLARLGRDKVTLVIDPELAGFGAWIEHLLAESLGKNGLGLVPVDREPLGAARAYAEDRVFVRIALDGDGSAAAAPTPAVARPPTGASPSEAAPTPASSAGASSAQPSPAEAAAGPIDSPLSVDDLLSELEAAGHPVLRMRLSDPIDIGGELVRWQVAAAFAGAVLGVDPFDHPDVEQSRELASRALDVRGRRGDGKAAGRVAARARETPASGKPAEPLVAAEPLTLYGDTALRLSAGADTLVGELARHLARLRPAGYASLLAYVAPTPARDSRLASIRALLRDRTRRATTAGYGPQYLHSTGQLHKGGPRTGWFLQLTADHPADRPVPGKPYSFGELIDAQAAGDLVALESRDLPVLRVHLGPDPDEGLAALEAALGSALDLGST